jgi:hypothetical protein
MIKAIPIDNNRFIIVSNRSDLIDDNRAERTPFHLAASPSPSEIQTARFVNFYPFRQSREQTWRRFSPAWRDGELGGIPKELNEEETAKFNEQLRIRLLSPIDHGREDLRKYMSDPAWFALAWRSAVAITGDYAVLVNQQTGLYWIFSLRNGSLKKTGNIFKKMTPEILNEGGFFRTGTVRMPVICVNPEKDGTILVAAEDEDFFLTEKGDPGKEANEIWQNMPEPKTMQDFANIFDQKERELYERNPYIVWYRLYPEEGRVEMLSQAPEGGTLNRGDARGAWRPMPDGSVRMGHLNMEIIEVKSETGQGDDADVAKNQARPDTAFSTSQAGDDVRKSVVNK